MKNQQNVFFSEKMLNSRKICEIIIVFNVFNRVFHSFCGKTRVKRAKVGIITFCIFYREF